MDCDSVTYNTINSQLELFVDAKSPVSRFDIDNHASGNYVYDMVQQASWDSTTSSNQASKQPNKVTKDSKSCLDLSVSTANVIAIGSANRVTIGRYYTAFYIWYPRDSDTGWRTLHRGDNDHLVIVQNNNKNLGMYSNRDGQFRVSISIVSSQKICVFFLFI